MFYVDLNNPMDFLAIVLVVIASASLGMVAKAWVERNSAPKSHRRYKDKILERLRRLDELHAEAVDVESDLRWLWERAPDAQARLIVDRLEVSAELPKRFRALAKRFGFDVVDDPEEPPVRTRPMPHAAAEAETPVPTAWSLPPPASPKPNGNGHHAS